MKLTSVLWAALLLALPTVATADIVHTWELRPGGIIACDSRSDLLPQGKLQTISGIHRLAPNCRTVYHEKETGRFPQRVFYIGFGDHPLTANTLNGYPETIMSLGEVQGGYSPDQTKWIVFQAAIVDQHDRCRKMFLFIYYRNSEAEI